MRPYAKKAAAIGFLVFLALWIVGAVRGLTLPYPTPLPISIASGRENSFYSNPQVSNNLKQIGLMETPTPLLLDNIDVEKIRVHEKRGTLTSNTTEFEADSKRVQDAIEALKAEVFTYSKSGIDPNRKLVLEIGVNPDRFDQLVDKLRGIGVLSSISVEQKDRTNEFRELHAKRQSLKKKLEGIHKIREGKTLTLDDAYRHEQKVQELEEQIQQLGIKFGDLLGKESFYHVHLTLTEFQPGDRRDHSYTPPQRIFHAFLWAVAWWFAAALAASLVVGTGVSVWVLRQKEPA